MKQGAFSHPGRRELSVFRGTTSSKQDIKVSKRVATKIRHCYRLKSLLVI
jgi:hypothetical protein